jgi:pantothenate kinase
VIPAGLLERITDRPPLDRRFVVAIAGPPASGKTTLAAALQDALPSSSAILGMDAFHYDDAILVERAQRSRKGAPFTFDVAGYRRCLEVLIHESESDIAIPVFDRQLELSRNAAVVVPPSCEVIITEGNYLLLDHPDWRPFEPLFDLTVFLNVNTETIRARIIERWQQHGFERAEAERRAEHNDLPNARTVLAESRPADLTIESD